jgi:DNA-binding transcriptional LysR family regulator
MAGDPGTSPGGRGARGRRPPDIEELRTLCAAAELGSLGRAAIRLHASQPALSKRLANLEALAGAKLLERSTHGVKLTPAGRRLYDEARKLLEQADRINEILAGIARSGGPVRLAASHSASDAFVAGLLGHLNERRALPVELMSANSTVVRDLVADGRADLGVAASRPHHTPYPGVRELSLSDDEVICAVPPGHRWAGRDGITLDEFLATPMVMRDPSSNSRWTVEAVLRERGLELPPPLVEAGTPAAARQESQTRTAPVLVSRSVLAGHGFHELPIDGIAFRREYVLVLPAYGEPSDEVKELIDQLRHEARVWLRGHRLRAGS